MHQDAAVDGPLSGQASGRRKSVGLPAGCDPLLTEKQLSEWLGISLPTLQRLRANGTGPRFVQLSERRVAYRKSVVEHWLELRTKLQIGGGVE